MGEALANVNSAFGFEPANPSLCIKFVASPSSKSDCGSE